MRILIINSLYYPHIIGGAEVSTQLLAESLAKYTINEIHILTTGEKNCDEEINGVTIHRKRMSNIMPFWKFKHEKKYYKRLIYKALDFYSLSNAHIFSKALKEIEPDVVHINNIYGFSPSIINVIHKEGIPIVFTYRDYYCMCPKANLMQRGHICNRTRIACRVYRKILLLSLYKVDAHIAISNYVKNCLSAHLNISSEIIYNSIKVDYNQFEEFFNYKQKRKKDTIDFVYVGSLIKTKGILEFSREFASIVDDHIRLHILGEGPLKKEIEALNCKRIILHGFKTGREKDSLMKNMDISVCPSLWNEPFGRVVIEAFQYAMPVIGSNMGGIPELIEDNVGRICIIKEAHPFLDAINYYRTEWKGIDNNTHNHMLKQLQKFDIAIQIKKYQAVYTRIIKE